MTPLQPARIIIAIGIIYHRLEGCIAAGQLHGEIFGQCDPFKKHCRAILPILWAIFGSNTEMHHHGKNREVDLSKRQTRSGWAL